MSTSLTTTYTYRTPVGPVHITVCNDAVVGLTFATRASTPRLQSATKLGNACSTQVLEYLAGKRMAFDIPIRPQGSAFQLRVWEAVQAIPYGQTRTAREIAENIGTPESHRSVGAALAKNPIAILIPTHRVVTRHNQLGTGLVGCNTKRLLTLDDKLREIERKFA